MEEHWRRQMLPLSSQARLVTQLLPPQTFTLLMLYS